MTRTTVRSDSSFAKQLSRGTASLTTILRGRRLLQLHRDFSPRLTGFIGRATSVLVLILIMTLVAQPDLLVRGVKASSAMLPEQRPQPASLEVPLPAAPQARIFHLHPRNAASVEAMPTPTLPLLLFFYLVIMA